MQVCEVTTDPSVDCPLLTELGHIKCQHTVLLKCSLSLETDFDPEPSGHPQPVEVILELCHALVNAIQCMEFLSDFMNRTC